MLLRPFFKKDAVTTASRVYFKKIYKDFSCAYRTSVVVVVVGDAALRDGRRTFGRIAILCDDADGAVTSVHTVIPHSERTERN